VVASGEGLKVLSHPPKIFEFFHLEMVYSNHFCNAPTAKLH